MTNIFASKPLAELSLVELRKKKKSIEIMSYVLLALLLIILIYTGVAWYMEGTSPKNLVFMGGFVAIAYLMDVRLKKIEAELTTRQ